MKTQLVLSALAILSGCADESGTTVDTGTYDDGGGGDDSGDPPVTKNYLMVSNATGETIYGLYLYRFDDASWDFILPSGDSIADGESFNYSGYGPGTWSVVAIDGNGNHCEASDSMQVNVSAGQVLAVTFRHLTGEWSPSTGCS